MRLTCSFSTPVMACHQTTIVLPDCARAGRRGPASGAVARAAELARSVRRFIRWGLPHDPVRFRLTGPDCDFLTMAWQRDEEARCRDVPLTQPSGRADDARQGGRIAPRASVPAEQLSGVAARPGKLRPIRIRILRLLEQLARIQRRLLPIPGGVRGA